MDKNKIIEAAAKLVAKGAYDKAIKEYQKVLEVDARDVRVLQKMGELFQKKNDNAQAAQYFTRVAESYSADGFFLKAVALYKQVLKLDASLVDVNLKLAELHQQLGLMSEAMAYFQIVANHHDKAGNTKASLDTLKRMVDLDPENVSSKVKLAELYAREGMNREAATEFRRASEYLKRHARADDWLRVAERLSTLEPENTALAKELAHAYLERADQKRALAKLQVCFKADGRDVETLQMLAQAFEGLGQVSKTVSVYKELARIHQEKGRTVEAEGLWVRIGVLDPDDADLAERRASVPAPQAAPAAAAARPAPQAAAPAPQPPAAPPPAPAAALGREQLAKLLTETDVYVKYGLHDKALEHLRKIFTVDPEDLDAHEKAYQIYVAAGNAEQADEQLLNVLRLCTRRGEVERAQPYLARILEVHPDHPEVPAFLAVLRAEDVAGGGLEDDAILVTAHDDEEIQVSPPPPDALAGLYGSAGDDLALASAAAASAGDEVVGDATDDDVLSPTQAGAVLDDSDPFVTDDDAVVTDMDDAVVTDDVTTVVTDDEDEPLFARAAPPPPARPAPAPQASRPAPARPSVIAPPPPPAPAYDDAEDAVVVTSDEVGPEDDAFGSYDVGDDAAAFAAATSPDEDVESTRVIDAASLAAAVAAAEAAPMAEAAPEEEEPAQEECDEAEFFIDQGLLEEAREILETVSIAFPGHRRGGLLMERLEAAEAEASGQAAPAQAAAPAAAPLPSVDPVAPAPEGDVFNLAEELAGQEETIAGPLPGEEDFQYSVEEVFAEFKKGLEKVVKPEDVDTHYDLGIAYKEMGLIDDAINEFQVARQGCAGKKKELDCLTMVGLLQLQKGDGTAAVTAFRDALATEHAAVGDTAKALGYELALAWEAAGQPGKALFHFQRVQREDAGFRDVAAHVARLAATTRPVEDPLPARARPGSGAARPAAPTTAAPAPGGGTPKTRKVGYV